MSKTQAINPHTGEVFGEYPYISNEELVKKLDRSYEAFRKYRNLDNKSKAEKFAKLAQVIEQNAEKYAEVIVRDQGKAITEAIGEVKKAAKHALYYSQHIDEVLKDEVYQTEYQKSVVEFHPVGPIFHVAPFNFPFWLVFKGVIPAMVMGNTVISKTASSCPNVGHIVEEAFHLAGFDNGEFQHVLTTQEQSDIVIAHKHIHGASFTGSTKGGASVASFAGKYCKKAVMELGGSDPFIVLDDADVNLAVTTAIASRLRNSGQVCSCAKRFIVHEKVYNEFRDKLVEKVKALKVGDPMKKDTNIGPLAKKKTLEDIIRQVDEGVKQGGKVLLGGKQPDAEELKKGYYYLPTIVEVEEGNILLKEETFGPVLPLIKVKSDDEIIRVANDTEYGLGGIIIGKDVERAQKIGKCVNVGGLFINAPLSSDSRFPSGGVKNSGFGRECGIYGVHEFANVKTVVVK
jgi:succinate-semialdehyde dehydrogenase/glutarate-semialdehyde dehydrogenase